mmetsp:Transcript_85953/g.184235  ORF Transcript_85953/g.184235 Transcript_85953/m.184235 type:complete len:230 (+) Transcript_85953:1123-1812(+)
MLRFPVHHLEPVDGGRAIPAALLLLRRLPLLLHVLGSPASLGSAIGHGPALPPRISAAPAALDLRGVPHPESSQLRPMSQELGALPPKSSPLAQPAPSPLYQLGGCQALKHLLLLVIASLPIALDALCGQSPLGFCSLSGSEPLRFGKCREPLRWRAGCSFFCGGPRTALLRGLASLGGSESLLRHGGCSLGCDLSNPGTRLRPQGRCLACALWAALLSLHPARPPHPG